MEREQEGSRPHLVGRHLWRRTGQLLAALLAGLWVGSAAASAASGGPTLTFTRDVAPILLANCQECHRPGGLGPFSVLSYDTVKAQASLIKEYTRRRLMPPWKAADGYGEFLDQRRLTDEQIRTIGQWVDAGAPQGDPKEMPSPRQFAGSWFLGTPDLVLDAGEAYPVPADGDDIYRDFVLPFRPDQDQWISAVEVAPGSPAVVHHVALFVDLEGKSPAMDEADPGPGFTVYGTDAGFHPAVYMDAWTPGVTPRFLPEGTAWKIPAHAYLVMQIHYHLNGQEQSDRTRIGLHFARGPIEKRVRTSFVGNVLFRIPPGAGRYPVSASVRLPRDLTALAVWPHMHLIGREMKVTATLPGAIATPMVWVPQWDFHWQQVYSFKAPVKLPAGARIDLQAYYDNSENNPNNPNLPPVAVTFGPQSTDEMCFCFLRYTVDQEHLSQGIRVDDDGLEIQF